MHTFTSAYLAYGINIPDINVEVLDEGFADGSEGGFPDVGSLRAGPQYGHFTFLVTACNQAELGEVTTVAPQDVSAAQYADWDLQLRAAAAALGITGDLTPGWFITPGVV